VTAALHALPLQSFALDGEIVALDERGRSSFQRLQERMGLTRPADIERARSEVPVSAAFFDALSLDGRDLRRLPLEARKECLKLLLPPRGVSYYGDHVVEHGAGFVAGACEQGLEGVVAKKRDSPYVGKRSRDWLKIKCQLRQEFVIGGYTVPQGTRAHFGALHLGLYERGELVYVSKVGTGFDERALKTISEKLRPLSRPTSPFARGTPGGHGHHWVEPRLVGEVRFTEWTRDGGVRHPAFLGLRDDKHPEDCVRETPAGTRGEEAASASSPRGESAGRRSTSGRGSSRPEASPKSDRRGASVERGAAGAGEADERRVTITNPEKVFWPDEGYTKSDLVAYYEAVSPWLLAYLKDR